MHDNVYHMPPPAPASAAAAVTSQVMSAVSRQQQQQQPRHDRQPTASSSAPATSGLLLSVTGRNIGGFLAQNTQWECSVRFREIAECECEFCTYQLKLTGEARFHKRAKYL